jgi:hypothetical protein
VTTTTTAPATRPVAVGPDRVLIPNLAPAEDAYVPVSSLVIRGAEPILVDTGAPVHRARWHEKVSALSTAPTCAGCS